uniref:FBA_2 domain-containing protein n=2 Tax=Caenorhabditis tropicalis TaxID=1561998 RepID=A0A1I7TD51_9PELO
MPTNHSIDSFPIDCGPHKPYCQPQQLAISRGKKRRRPMDVFSGTNEKGEAKRAESDRRNGVSCEPCVGRPSRTPSSAIWYQKCATMSLITTRNVPVEELKYVFEKVEISEFLKISLRNNEDFEIGTVRFQMVELKIDRAFWITNETFLAMDCARIDLTGNRNLPIRDFVFQWL